MNFRRFPKASGIYQILNTVTGKKYVGLATNIRLRCKCHRVELRANQHGNSHLQNTWNLYGEQSFEFSILELCTFESLPDREHYWIGTLKTLDRDFGYNIRESKVEHFKMPDETKQKIGAANKGKQRFGKDNSFFGKHHSQETIAAIVANRNNSDIVRKSWVTKKKNGYTGSDYQKSKARESAINNPKFTTARKVIDGSTGTVYNSVKEAAKFSGYSLRSFSDKLTGKSKNNTSFQYTS